MSPGAEEPVPIGERLLAAGWRQGVLARLPGVRVLFNTLLPAGSWVTGERAVKNKEVCIVVSQDCDIRGDEPYVELLVCRLEKPGTAYLAQIDRNSARSFVVNPGAALVVHARNRILVDKQSLLGATPSPFPGDPTRHDRFVQWLGRRFDRPALPDEFDRLFRTRLESALAQLDAADPALGRAFSAAVAELRVTFPLPDLPPYRVRILGVLWPDGLTEEGADALDAAASAIRGILEEGTTAVDEIRWAVPEEVSLAEYLATRPLFLEYLTFRGDEVLGAPPPDL